jgi:hypothetical protein
MIFGDAIKVEVVLVDLIELLLTQRYAQHFLVLQGVLVGDVVQVVEAEGLFTVFQVQ